MIGNSFTDANNLEEMVRAMLEEDIATALAGHHIYAMRFRQPGGRLREDAGNAAVQSTIAERAWNWVVLQEQSEIPGFFGMQNEEYKSSLQAVNTLNGWIQAAHADTVLLQTWGQRAGDPLNPILYKDFWTMQGRLAKGYEEMQTLVSTTDRPVPIAPAGLAFGGVFDAVQAKGLDPTTAGSDFFNLYAEDGKHPSVEGSYLTACVVYATLSGRDPRRLTYKPAEMSEARRVALQEIAFTTVERFNKGNAVNHQFLEERQKKKTGNKSHDDNQSKKPYVPLNAPETSSRRRNGRLLWFLFFAASAAMATAALQRRQQQSPKRSATASVYSQLAAHDEQHHDMELVDIPGV